MKEILKISNASNFNLEELSKKWIYWKIIDFFL